MMFAPPRAIKALRQLRDLGLRVSIDDFGLGCSSLTQIGDLPVDTLKVDRSLISGITRERSYAAIATAIVTIADGLDLEVVAEGVETAEQLEFVRNLHCHRYQGFLLSHPEPADRMGSLLCHVSSDLLRAA
jgi:EAL domain-containing protein (putative c-di-GMP-specific phosphodiesterase class I)